jgi:hypothetical protein
MAKIAASALALGFSAPSQATQTATLALPLAMPFPCLEHYLASASLGRVVAYNSNALAQLEITLDAVSLLDGKSIHSFLDWLCYVPDRHLLNKRIAAYTEDLVAKLARFHSLSSLDLQRLDVALFCLFESVDAQALEKTFAPILDRVLNTGVIIHAQLPHVSSGLVYSYLKSFIIAKRIPRLVDAALESQSHPLYVLRLLLYLLDPNEFTLNCDQRIRLLDELPGDHLTNLLRIARRISPVENTNGTHGKHGFRSWFQHAVTRTKRDRAAALALTGLSQKLGIYSPTEDDLESIALTRPESALINASRGCGGLLARVVSEDYLLPYGMIGILSPMKRETLRDYYARLLAYWYRHTYSDTVKLPIISVLLTVHNPDETYLRMAIASILQQTASDVEIVLIDDGTPYPASARIEEELLRQVNSTSHRRRTYQYLRNQKSIGQYASRNLAIALAKGEFIAINDDDDISHPQRLATQVSCMLPKSSAKYVYGSHIRISDNVVFQWDGNETGEVLGDSLASSVWHRSVFSEIGFFLEARSRGDVEFRSRFLRTYLCKDALIKLKPPLLIMRGAPATVSNKAEFFYRSATQAFRRAIDLNEQFSLGNEIIPYNLKNLLRIAPISKLD